MPATTLANGELGFDTTTHLLYVGWNGTNYPAGAGVTVHNNLTGRDTAGAHPSTALTVTTTGFGGVLSSADDTVQEALDTLDDHNHDAAYAAVGHNHDAAYAAIGHNHSGVYQPLDGDLTAIAALATVGYAKRTGVNTWIIDNTVIANPMSAVGDMIYGGTSGVATRLAGNISATKNFLSQTGDGGASSDPAWSTVTSTDVGLGNVTNNAQVTNVGATAPITSSGGTTPTISTSMATGKLIGRGTAETGVMEEITLGTNLSLAGTTLNAAGATVHSSLSNLAYADAGHTGFEPTVAKGNLAEATSSVLTIGSGTGAVIGAGTTIQVKQAGAAQAGYLSSADWNTFNSKADTSGYPVSADIWTDTATGQVGTWILYIDVAQKYNAIVYNSSAADHDELTFKFFLKAGTYTFAALGRTQINAARVDWILDGVTVATAQDWYSGSTVNNVVKTIASVSVVGSGTHTLRMYINGKNALSSGYYFVVTKISIYE